jgi:SagB-type dehydrogenase family enzyme
MTSYEHPHSTPYCIVYHEKTKYTPEGLSRRTRSLDWDAQPQATKTYTTGSVIDLRPYLPGQPASFPASELSSLSRLLYLTYGVTAVIPYPDRPFYMRSAPSAGGLYPAEVYMISRGTLALEAGIYNYQSSSHSLIGFWKGDAWQRLKEAAFGAAALETAHWAIVVTGVFERSAWRYEDRAYRRIFLDSGHLLGNLELAAALEKYHVSLFTGFADDLLRELLFLAPQEEEGIAIAALSPLQNPPEPFSALPSSIRRDYPEIPEGQRLYYLHEVSKIAQLPTTAIPSQVTEDKYNFPFCLKIPTKTVPMDWEDNRLEQAIVRRRSTRQYTGEDLTFEELKLLLDFTYQPKHYGDQGFDPVPEYAHLPLLSTFVAVLGVEGLEPGCYYYAPEAQELRQIRFKNFRKEVFHLCLGQDLGRDSGAVIFHTADLPVAANLYGERVYRTLHLDSGHLAQRLNLAAMRLGLGVSGIAGFFDDQVNDLLGIPEQEAVLYLTTLGRPLVQGRGSA